MKKKLFIAFIFVLFFIGINKEVNAYSTTDTTDYVSYSVDENYSYTYQNDTEKEIDFKGFVFLKSFYNKGYARHYYSNSSDFTMYFINTRNDNLSTFYFEDEMNYSYYDVESKHSRYVDNFDYASQSNKYNYITAAVYAEFVVPAHSVYNYSTSAFYGIRAYPNTINFLKPSEYNLSADTDWNPIDDAKTLMGLVSLFSYNIEQVSEIYGFSIGDNYLEYKITDSNGNVVYRSLLIHVLKDSAPVITATKDIVAVDVNNPKTTDEIEEYFKAIDEIEGDVSKRLHIYTNYSYSKPKVGKYLSTATVTDLMGYEASLSFYIVVFDSMGIIKNYDIDLSYLNEYSDEEIMVLSGLDTAKSTYEIIDENYSESPNIVGDYYYKVNIINEYNYEYPVDLRIHVIDDIPPVVSTKSISTTAATNITDEEIKNNIVISDYSKTNIVINRDSYIYNQVGSYIIYISVYDSYENKTDAELIINVSANTNINYYNNRIRIYNDHALSQAEVVAFLRDVSSNIYDDTTSSYVESDYFNSPLISGEYSATLITTLPSGIEVKEDYVIEVFNVEKESIIKHRNAFMRLIYSILQLIKALRMILIKTFVFLFK